ncbi:lipoprotein NlpI [Pseudidiomarina insulisalsae]|uniref:Lipoprotein NlpI n=1 Tax=Pseudidiomarina insulisalsae TaxID=575789 RepID=A0A432YEQ9_9GAMM|nr:lipoprotein NlpI [Pseudidiomarina insulisalsae]RUO59438.1 lipoprotein NlpI [Pseudidiomarina insulisalsae]
MSYWKVATLLLGWAVLAGCSATSATAENSLNNLLIATPQVADDHYQLELAKLNEIISADNENLDAEMMGELLYRRGMLYDAVGLVTLSRIDFNRALEYQPRLADAYNYLGIHYSQVGQYEMAYEALDAAIELEPEHPYAYLNRGVAAYYDNRFDLAYDDLDYFFQRNPNDPYRALWRFFAAVEQDRSAAAHELAEAMILSDNEAWAWNLVKLFVNGIAEQDFLSNYATLNMSEHETLAERLCEVYFYLGKYHQLQGNWQSAAVYFKLALATNVHVFLEYRYAGVEMEWSQYKAQQED